MKSMLRGTGLAAVVLGLIAAPALAAPVPGMPQSGAPTEQAVPAEAAGSTGIPGGNAVTGVNSDPAKDSNDLRSSSGEGSGIGKSQAELPNNDAGTPINNGPNGTGGGAGNLNSPKLQPKPQ